MSIDAPREVLVFAKRVEASAGQPDGIGQRGSVNAMVEVRG
jgi:hypothetical protein